MDILPTIAGLANVAYRNNALGKDLLKLAPSANDHVAFIVDPDTRRIGIVSTQHFYSCNIDGSGEQVGSVVDNNPVKLADTLLASYRKKASALYETSRYLLLNNKKKNR